MKDDYVPMTVWMEQSRLLRRVGRVLKWVEDRVFFRACTDLQCQIGQGGHSHHLTGLGHWYYVGRHL